SLAQLSTHYRPGGWTVAQVVHHVADSHLNSYTRFRLALTEDHPTIRPYDEAAWAELPDAVGEPVEVSLDLLDALHARWARLLRSLSPAQLDRSFCHPEDGEIGLRTNIGLYAWHGRHHLAHISTLAQREGW
ncbi:putative metal-dependent hydrolase, partial [bacterium]